MFSREEALFQRFPWRGGSWAPFMSSSEVSMSAEYRARGASFQGMPLGRERYKAFTPLNSFLDIGPILKTNT